MNLPMMTIYNFVKDNWKIVVGVAACGLSFLGGYASHQTSETVKTVIDQKSITDAESKVRTEEQQKSQVAIQVAVSEAKQQWESLHVSKNVDVIERRKDGSISKETKVTVKTDDEKKSESQTKAESSSVATATDEKKSEADTKVHTETEKHESITDTKNPLPRFSVGVQALYPPKDLITGSLSKPGLEVEAGIRVFNQLWLNASFNIKSTDVGLGISFQF